jgi:hypothetical protein
MQRPSHNVQRRRVARQVSITWLPHTSIVCKAGRDCCVLFFGEQFPQSKDDEVEGDCSLINGARRPLMAWQHTRKRRRPTCTQQQHDTYVLMCKNMSAIPSSQSLWVPDMSHLQFEISRKGIGGASHHCLSPQQPSLIGLYLFKSFNIMTLTQPHCHVKRSAAPQALEGSV